MKRVMILACVCAVICTIPGISQSRVSGQRAVPAGAKIVPGDRSVLDRNLLGNAGAEAEMIDTAVPGWGAAQDSFVTETYGHTAGEWDWGMSGCPGCGKRYFRIAWEGPESSKRFAAQTVDVSHAAEAIDGGQVTTRLSGYVGALRGGDTTAQITAVYLDSAGKELGRLETPFVDVKALPKPEQGDASFLHIDAHGPTPSGTRKIEVQLIAKPTGGSGSYLGVADNLSLVLTRK